MEWPHKRSVKLDAALRSGYRASASFGLVPRIIEIIPAIALQLVSDNFAMRLAGSRTLVLLCDIFVSAMRRRRQAAQTWGCESGASSNGNDGVSAEMACRNQAMKSSISCALDDRGYQSR